MWKARCSARGRAINPGEIGRQREIRRALYWRTAQAKPSGSAIHLVDQRPAPDIRDATNCLGVLRVYQDTGCRRRNLGGGLRYSHLRRHN